MVSGPTAGSEEDPFAWLDKQWPLVSFLSCLQELSVLQTQLQAFTEYTHKGAVVTNHDILALCRQLRLVGEKLADTLEKEWNIE